MVRYGSLHITRKNILIKSIPNRPMIDITSLLGGLSSVTSVLDTLDSMLKGSRGTRRSLLLELEGNIRLALLGKQGGIPADKLVKKLETRAMQQAMESDFNFRSLKSGKLKKRVAGDSAQMQRYIGWTTERLFTNLYLRIRELQNIVELDTDGGHFRVTVRLQNIFRMMLLLVRHIRS
jgi:hypothetical protein